MIKKTLTVLGLMSGTSLDGIDISIVRTNGIKLRSLNLNYFHSYSTSFRQKLKNFLAYPEKYYLNKKRIDKLISQEHYKAIKNFGYTKKINLIGFHGQTLFHNPSKKISLQAGSGQILSNLTRKNVIFDFRKNDILSGGEGAPLAPIYHKFLIQKLSLDLPCCFINIGGVSNLTYWDGKELIGFDTGPGNCLLDEFMRLKFNKNFDLNGNIASKGTLIPYILHFLLKNKFFVKPYPKSIDKNHFQKDFFQLNDIGFKNEDFMCSLVHFTSETILKGIFSLPQKPKNVILTGGGSNNIFLNNMIRNKLNKYKIWLYNKNINKDFIESELIAYIATRSLYKFPYTYPQTTGVKKPLSGGTLFKPYRKPFVSSI